MIRKALLITAIATCLAALPLGAQLELVGEAPAHSITADLTQAQVAAALASGDPDLINKVRTAGLLVFSTPFNNFDGHGDGPFVATELPHFAFGHRPTLQGNGQFLRLNGLDAQACNECHVVVKNSTLPPTLGLAGVGTVPESAFPLTTLADFADSRDGLDLPHPLSNRVVNRPLGEPDLPLNFDGEADFDGRFINPPFLFGGGGVELLGKEMTLDLQAYLIAALIAPPGTVISLDTHGTHYGTLTSVDHHNVQVNLEGVGPSELAAGAIISKEEARDALVVRPFGRKGDNFTMRDFDRGAMQFHFGIQPVEVHGEGNDEDADGVINEVTIAEMSALHTFDVTNPRPFMDPLDVHAQAGATLFDSIGCTYCHHPFKTTYQKFLPLAHPETPHNPLADIYALLNLKQIVGFEQSGLGLKIRLFADLKRHDMGDRLAETCELCPEESQVGIREFTTARLWGIGDTAPYIHDGRATTLRKAIDFHGCNPDDLTDVPPHNGGDCGTGGASEAQFARDNYFALSEADQARVLHFLRQLRTPNDPNLDIVP